jgi:hypothetical protein
VSSKDHQYELPHLCSYVDHGYYYHSAFFTLHTPLLANTFF